MNINIYYNKNYNTMKTISKSTILIVAIALGSMAYAGTENTANKVPYAGYLFAYFASQNTDGEQGEAIRFALSRDGYKYHALNGNKPVINSADIAAKKGVRDPHIMRCEDGKTFYMVATDMRAAEGWNSNHGIVLLKSTDLISWTASRVDIKASYKEFSSIDRTWAPQTIYDPSVGKYMVYFSMRSPEKPDDVIYYAYANADFTSLEAAPQLLFRLPEGKSCIDGDIIFKDGKYFLFFKTEGHGNAIKKAVSDKLTGGYLVLDKVLPPTKEAVEGSCVFQLSGEDKYIMMYDVYRARKYEFAISTDLETFTAVDSLVEMDFKPRHGTVMGITEEEFGRLEKYFAINNEK
jgi:hypothetical protein